LIRGRRSEGVGDEKRERSGISVGGEEGKEMGEGGGEEWVVRRVREGKEWGESEVTVLIKKGEVVSVYLVTKEYLGTHLGGRRSQRSGGSEGAGRRSGN